MRVMFINTVGGAFRGGGNIDTRMISDYLVQNGLEVYEAFIFDENSEYMIDRLINVFPEKITAMKIRAFDYLIKAKIKKLVNDIHPDVIDIQDKRIMSAAAGHNIPNTKKVFTIIEEFSADTIRMLAPSVKGFFLERKRKYLIKLLRKEKYLISNSNSSRNILIENGLDPKNIRIIYRSLPPIYWYETDIPPVSIDRREIRFLVPGRISKEKGVIEIVEAMIELNKEGNKEKYVVSFVGKGALSKWLLRKKNEFHIDNMHIVDPVPIEEMLGIYMQSDITLLPVLCEDSFPRVALESLMAGRPIISTLRGGIKEAVDGIEGSYIRLDDPHDLKNAMRECIDNSRSVAEMSRRIIFQRENITAKFNHQRMIEDYIKFYDYVVNDI